MRRATPWYPCRSGARGQHVLTFIPLDDESLPAPAAPAAEHGTVFGTALHRVMELSDLQETADVETIVEGVIDLMYREDDGSLVIADFTTDKVLSDETLAGYWRQLAQYADMIQRITDQAESEVVLIFCRVGGVDVRRRGVAR